VPPNRTRVVPRGLQTLFHAGSLIGVTDGQMIRVRLHAAFLAALTVTGVLAPAWLAVARQAPDDRARIKAPPAGKAAGPSAVDIGGNWILREGSASP
jgi:hypothetical protein